MCRKKRLPTRAVLRAQFLADQEVGQWGQLCQMKNTCGFNNVLKFLAGGFYWLASGLMASAKWILDKNSKIHPASRLRPRDPL